MSYWDAGGSCVLNVSLLEVVYSTYGRLMPFLGQMQKLSFRAVPTRSTELTVHIEQG